MKEHIRSLVMSYGVQLCGFAGIERFHDAPEGFAPSDLYPGCESVISFGIVLPKGLLKTRSKLVYGHFNNHSFSVVDTIALKAAQELAETFQCTAIPVPCDSPYDYWDEAAKEGKGLLSMKHTAVAAGLGCIGKNTLFMNRRYGNLITLGAILTDLSMTSDEPYENCCIDSCTRCVKGCLAGAIDNGHVNQKLCRSHAYGITAKGFQTVECNLCRTICPINQGQPTK